MLRVTQPQNLLLDFFLIYSELLRQYSVIRLDVDTSSARVNRKQNETDAAIRLTEQTSKLLVDLRTRTFHIGSYGFTDYLARFVDNPDRTELDWVFRPQSVNNWRGKHIDSGWAQLYRRVSQTPYCRHRITRTSSQRCGSGSGPVFWGAPSALQFDGLVPVPRYGRQHANKVDRILHGLVRGMNRVQYFIGFVVDALASRLDLPRCRAYNPSHGPSRPLR
jgi:hypothetical protein